MGSALELDKLKRINSDTARPLRIEYEGLQLTPFTDKRSYVAFGAQLLAHEQNTMTYLLFFKGYSVLKLKNGLGEVLSNVKG